MSIGRGVLNKFNRGVISADAFAREDISRLQNSAETMTNFQPQRQGAMKYRAGFEWLDDVPIAGAAVLFPFSSTVDDSVMVEMYTNGSSLARMVFFENDVAIPTGSTVSSSITNGGFDSDIAGWTTTQETSDVLADWRTGGELQILGNGSAEATAYQTVTAEVDVLHSLSISVTSVQSVRVRIGSSGASSAEYHDIELHKGDAVLNFTPTGDFTITLSNYNNGYAVVDQVSLLVNTDVFVNVDKISIIPSSLYSQAGLRTIKTTQNGDKLYFAASSSTPPFVLTRYPNNSFAVELYVNKFGPYDSLNISRTTMNLDWQNLLTKLTFSDDLSSAADDTTGTVYKYSGKGQRGYARVSLDDSRTNSITVFGAGTTRDFTVSVATTGAYTTILLERSLDGSSWVTHATYSAGTAFGPLTVSDGFDNVEWAYRLRVTDIGASTDLTMTLDYPYGVNEGHFRSDRDVSTVFQEGYWDISPGGANATRDWYRGSWGGLHKYPTAVEFFQGRLWWAAGDTIWGTETDRHDSFDRTITGDSAAVQRTMAGGPSQTIRWLVASNRLLMGLEKSEVTVRAAGIGETITDLDCNLAASSTAGAADISPVLLDSNVVFVQRAGNKLINSSYSFNADANENIDLNMLNDTILAPGVVKLVIARAPQTMIYALLADGTIAVLNLESTEDVLAWSLMTIPSEAGSIVDIAVMPEATRDTLWVVTSTIVAKQADPLESIGGNISKHFDAFVDYGVHASTTYTGLDHFEGDYVSAWIDGVLYDNGGLGIQVSLGAISGMPAATVGAVIGLPYVADYKSNILGDYTDKSVLTASKRIINTGLIMQNYALGSVTIGPDTSSLSAMPALEDGNAAASETSYNHYPFEFNGESEVDPRIHIRATGPCSILALTYEIKDTDRRSKAKKGKENV